MMSELDDAFLSIDHVPYEEPSFRVASTPVRACVPVQEASIARARLPRPCPCPIWPARGSVTWPTQPCNASSDTRPMTEFLHERLDVYRAALELVALADTVA